jgi:hypothetical protein
MLQKDKSEIAISATSFSCVVGAKESDDVSVNYIAIDCMYQGIPVAIISHFTPCLPVLPQLL